MTDAGGAGGGAPGRAVAPPAATLALRMEDVTHWVIERVAKMPRERAFRRAAGALRTRDGGHWSQPRRLDAQRATPPSSLGGPVRHWICSLPWGLRALLGCDRALAAQVVRAFAHVPKRCRRPHRRHRRGAEN